MINKKINNLALQRKIMFASFGFFAIVFEKANKVTPELKRYFRLLGKITKMYEKYMHKDWEDINRIVLKYENQLKKKGLSEKDMEIDYILASVSIISMYYEMTKGHKKWFYPMSYEQILDLQDEIIEDLEEKNMDYMINQTFDFVDYLVKKIFQLRSE